MAPKRKPMFNCTHCDYRSMIPSNVRGHVTRVHKITNPKIHECRFCGEMFSNLHKLNFHMGPTFCANTNDDFARELEEKAEKRKTNFYCLECNYQSYLSYNVISHMMNVHKTEDPKIHGCNCGESYRRASELKVHTLTCDQADENFRARPPPHRLNTVASNNRNFIRKSVSKAKTKRKESNSKVTMANLVKFQTKVKGKILMKNSAKSKSLKVRGALKANRPGKSGVLTKKSSGNIPKSSRNSPKSKRHPKDPLKFDDDAEQFNDDIHLPDKDYYECKQCDYHTAFKSNLKAHLNQVHKMNIQIHPVKQQPAPVAVPIHVAPLPQLHKCQKCKRVYQTTLKLKSHLRNGDCTNSKNTKVKTISAWGRRQGRKPAKLDRMFQCLECEYQSPYTCHVRTHMKLKHNVSEPKIHKCEFCSEMFQTIIILKKHMGDNCCVNTNEEFAEKVRAAEENKCYYNCLKCDYLSAYKHHIRNHMRVIHKIADPKFYSCEACGETFPKEPLVNAHLKTCLGQNAKDARKKTKMPNQIYVCEKCGIVFDDKNHYEGHKEFTNCKKRRKIIKKGEIFGELTARSNYIVPNNISEPGPSSVMNSRAVISSNVKITGKNAGLPGPALRAKYSAARRQPKKGKNVQKPARGKKSKQKTTPKPQPAKASLPVHREITNLPVILHDFPKEDLKPEKCYQCSDVFENKSLLESHLRQRHYITNHKWNEDFENKNSFNEHDHNPLISHLPQTSQMQVVKNETEEIILPDEDAIHHQTIDEVKQENMLMEDKDALNHQYMHTHHGEELMIDSSGYENPNSSMCGNPQSIAIDSNSTAQMVEVDDAIAIETTEVEGPSTDSENYYIFDDLSSTYITESQNFIVHGIDGAIYDGMEIGEGFNIDPSAHGNDSVFYQLQFCDGGGGAPDENIVLMEDSEFINANMTNNEDHDLRLVEFVPNNNNVSLRMEESESSRMNMTLENQYQCKLCNFACSSESTLEIHLKKHN